MEDESGYQPGSHEPVREREPRIHVTFFFSAHDTAEDFAKLDPLIKAADVYIPEASGWNQADLEETQKISQGEITPKALSKPISERTASDVEIILLYNSKKEIAFIDIPEDHRLNDGDVPIRDNIDRATTSIEAGLGYDIAIFEFGEAIKKYAAWMKEKDAYLSSRLQELLQQIPEKFPALRTKDDIQVVVQLGVCHTPVRHMLSEVDNVKMKTNEKVQILTVKDEITRRINQGMECSRELIEQGIAENLLINM